jgi:deoxyribodipyrimidine photo-lyase
MTSILWFKRDLRLPDHAALTHAALRGPLIPLYIAEPGLWSQPDAAARHWAFVAESLAGLDAGLARHGLRLILRRGEATEVLSALTARHGVTDLVSHQETGNLWTYARDRRVAAWAAANGIRWTELPGQGVIRRLEGRDGWAARRDALMAAPCLPVPPLSGPAEDPGPIPSAADLGLAPDPCPGRQPGGRDAGLALLGSFLDGRAATYRAAMSSPLAGASACSRLSPHLAWGTLSGREVAQATARAAAAGRFPAALSAFGSRLAWRDHFAQKLEDEPAIETTCLDPATEGLRDADPARLAAWTAGETGLPFLDACIRALAATGWLNFRMRAMVMAAASYHLWLDWRATGPVLARRFTDYDPGIHWPQVQMQSGTTGINTIRIYNPVKQGRDQDPAGAFTRRWLPELAPVPDALLQEPWRWAGAARLRYPAPVVDPLAAAAAAGDRLWALRRAPGHAQTAAAIARRHASRADGTGRFVNDRAARRGRPDTRQLSLDL